MVIYVHYSRFAHLRLPATKLGSRSEDIEETDVYLATTLISVNDHHRALLYVDSRVWKGSMCHWMEAERKWRKFSMEGKGGE